jgi:hypothetical protein
MATVAPKSARTLAAWNFAALFVFVATLIVAAVPAAKRALSGRTGDFTHLWLAAQAMVRGEDIYASGRGYYIYPPLTAFLFQPLAFLPESGAAGLWLILNVGLIATAAVIVGRELTRSWRLDGVQISWIIVTLAAALTVDKIRATFVLGQIDCFMLLGFALILRWTDRWPLGAGLAAGVAGNFKYMTLIFVPYFLFKRNYRAAIAAVLSFAFFLVLPAIAVGLRAALNYASVALSGIGKLAGLTASAAPDKMADITWDRSVSITSAIFRATRHYGLSDVWALFCVLALFTLIISVIFHLSRRNGVPLFRAGPSTDSINSPRRTSLEWAVLVFAALVFSPHATTRQMVLLFLLFALGAAILFSPAPAGLRIPIIAAMAIESAGLSFPPFGIGLNRAYWAWRAIGGPSWGALALICALVWAGSRIIASSNSLGKQASP